MPRRAPRVNPIVGNAYYLFLKRTPPELAMERAVAKLGEPYRAQHVVGKYILDLALLDRRVAIEVDGASHLAPKQMQIDAERTAYLEAQGWKVIRCWNTQALEDAEGWLRANLPANDNQD